MNPPSTPPKKDKLSQLGATDQIEQMAADLAIQENRPCVSNEDREKALDQMEEMSPPAVPPPQK